MKSGELKKIECTKKLVEAFFSWKKLEEETKKTQFVAIATIATSDVNENNVLLPSITITLFIYIYYYSLKRKLYRLILIGKDNENESESCYSWKPTFLSGASR